MFFSIIIPVYNVENYLKACLDSVLNQDYQSYEVILINDGSTDNSLDVCNYYASINPKIKVVSKPNGGLSSARNEGLKIANGNYIWFIDSDDWIVEHSFSTLFHHLKNDSIEMLGFYSARFYEDIDKMEFPKNNKNIAICSGTDYLKEFENFNPSACFYVYKKDFLQKNDFYFKEKLIHEDNYFNLMCFAQVQKIKKISDIFYIHRKRFNSITTSIISINRIDSYLVLIDQAIKYKKSKLNTHFLDHLISIYLSMLFQILIDYERQGNNLKIKKIISQAKDKIYFQKIYFSERRGILFEKLLYNLNGMLYFAYKKKQEKKYKNAI
jgi:glycosyltransferase involved in cell wall biosynthesis